MIVATPSQPAAHKSFEMLLSDALTRGRTETFALDHGVDHEALIRYANGAVSVYERAQINYVLARCERSRRTVVDLVRERRCERNAA